MAPGDKFFQRVNEKKVIAVERSFKVHSHICWVMTGIRINAPLEMTNLMFILDSRLTLEA